MNPARLHRGLLTTLACTTEADITGTEVLDDCLGLITVRLAAISPESASDQLHTGNRLAEDDEDDDKGEHTMMTPTMTTPTPGPGDLTIHVSFRVDHYEAYWSYPLPAGTGRMGGRTPGQWAYRAETLPALIAIVLGALKEGPKRPRRGPAGYRYKLEVWLAQQLAQHLVRVVIAWEPMRFDVLCGLLAPPAGDRRSAVSPAKEEAERPHGGRSLTSDRIH
jgi:hypothetical protein